MTGGVLWWCAVLCAVLGAATAQDPVGICGLEGFDLKVLQKRNQWSFSIHKGKEDCFTNTTEHSMADIESCVVHISICHPLPKQICDVDYASYCQVVTYNDTTVEKYVIGNYSSEHNFLRSAKGFQATRRGQTYPDVGRCSGTIVTNIIFECDADAHYDTSNSNITEYFNGVQNFGCIVRYNLSYSGACYVQPTLPSSLCSLTGFNTTAISDPHAHFTAVVKREKCFFDQGNCTLLLSFCHPLPLDISENCSNPLSTVCQTNTMKSSTNVKSWSMGEYTDYSRFHPNSEIVLDTGFYVDYGNGSIPTGGSGCSESGISTRVEFVCDKNAQWVNRDVTFYLDVTADKSDCSYTIRARYDGACYKEAHDTGSESSDLKTSYVGWILIAIFVLFVVSYLTIGSAFKYFVRNERGLRVIPNIDFWSNFILLTLEGCKFSLNVITCHRFGTPRSLKYDQL